MGRSIGVNWGTGILTARGKRYPFALQGLEIGGVGVSKVQATGQVYHLRQVADFAGTYIAVMADAAVVQGQGSSRCGISMVSSSISSPYSKA